MASKIILFDKKNFEGESVVLTNDARSLKGMGVYRDVESAIVIDGVFTLCADKDYGGTSWVLDSAGGPDGDGCYPTWEDWSSSGDNAGKKIESVDCTSEPPPGSIRVTGRITGFVECPEFTADDGTIYSLIGRFTNPYPPEQHITVIGMPHDVSTCQRGIAISVWKIEAAPGVPALGSPMEQPAHAQ